MVWHGTDHHQRSKTNWGEPVGKKIRYGLVVVWSGMSLRKSISRYLVITIHPDVKTLGRKHMDIHP